jgi:hypothetical protein
MTFGPNPIRPRSWRIVMQDRVFRTPDRHAPEYRSPAPREEGDPLPLRLFSGSTSGGSVLRAASRPGLADPSPTRK